jgi:hypothetical protein
MTEMQNLEIEMNEAGLTRQQKTNVWNRLYISGRDFDQARIQIREYKLRNAEDKPKGRYDDV